jgi:hypothetical protein
MNIVNYAVPMDQLDPVLDDLIGRLLKRPPRTLARTKRGVNKMLVNQVNLAYDALAWSEALDFFELGRNNWVNDLDVGPVQSDGSSDTRADKQQEGH